MKFYEQPLMLRKANINFLNAMLSLLYKGITKTSSGKGMLGATKRYIIEPINFLYTSREDGKFSDLNTKIFQ